MPIQCGQQILTNLNFCHGYFPKIAQEFDEIVEPLSHKNRWNSSVLQMSVRLSDLLLWMSWIFNQILVRATDKFSNLYSQPAWIVHVMYIDTTCPFKYQQPAFLLLCCVEIRLWRHGAPVIDLCSAYLQPKVTWLSKNTYVEWDVCEIKPTFKHLFHAVRGLLLSDCKTQRV